MAGPEILEYSVMNNIILLVSSAVLLTLPFFTYHLHFLAFAGFVPLFFALQNQSPKKAFLISYICGFLFYLGVLYWVGYVTIAGLIVLCLYLALYFGIFGIFIAWILTKTKGCFPFPIFWFLCSGFWLLLEYLQAHLFTGFGWALLGYSQYRNLPLIQIADFSGVYGVSFVVMFVNTAIYKILKKSFREMIIAVVILVIVIGYGYWRLRDNNGEYGDGVRVSVIQGNIPQELKWDEGAGSSILAKHTTLTKAASFDDTDLIIWPETALPDFFEKGEEYTEDVLNLAKEISTPILLGANTESFTPSPYPQYFNSAVLISKDGEIVDKYDKIHLVPFGEYVPFSKKFPILHELILGPFGEFTPGMDFKIFQLSAKRYPLNAKFGVLICYEDIFPELAGKFVKNGAQFLVVITNDAWYGKSPASYQHAACSVFRAIENRAPIVRCANTGYSCFIDSRGRIYDEVKENHNNLFVTGYKTTFIKTLPNPVLKPLKIGIGMRYF